MFGSSWHSRITWWAMAKSKIQQIKIQRHNKQAILISAHPFQQRRPTSIFPKHPHKPAQHSHCMKSTRGNKRTLIYVYIYIYAHSWCRLLSACAGVLKWPSQKQPCNTFIQHHSAHIPFHANHKRSWCRWLVKRFNWTIGRLYGKVLAGTIWNLQIQDMATPHMARGSLPHLEALDSFKLLHATPNSIRI